MFLCALHILTKFAFYSCSTHTRHPAVSWCNTEFIAFGIRCPLYISCIVVRHNSYQHSYLCLVQTPFSVPTRPGSILGSCNTFISLQVQIAAFFGVFW